MTSIMPPPQPSIRPSFECAKDNGALDAKFIRSVEKQFPHNRFDGRISSGADLYMADADVINLKGIGEQRANLLKSRTFSGIDTIGEFAAYPGDFDAPWMRLDRETVEVFRSLRASLQVCSLPVDEGKLGRAVAVTENDPGMEASVLRGKEVIQHNAGEDGAAYIVLKGDPTNNGFVPSFMDITLGGYKVRGRSGAELELKPINIQLGPGLPNDLRGVADELKRELEGKGLGAAIEQPREGGGIRVKVWSTLAID